MKEEVNSREISRIKYHCEKAKKELTFKDATVIEIELLFKGKDLILEITRVKFEKLCDKIFNSIIIPINEVLNIAKEKRDNIDEIILVGGSTRIPKIQKILQEFFLWQKYK